MNMFVAKPFSKCSESLNTLNSAMSNLDQEEPSNNLANQGRVECKVEHYIA